MYGNYSNRGNVSYVKNVEHPRTSRQLVGKDHQ